MRFQQPYHNYPPPMPPQRPDDDRGHGKLMLVLTLVGTLATVVSVLLALGIGPFDVGGGGGGGNDRGTPAATDPLVDDQPKAEQTRDGYVEEINAICVAKLDSLTERMTQLDDARASQDLDAFGYVLSQTTTEYQALLTRLKAVRMPKDDAEVLAWRDAYQKNVETLTEASRQWNAQDYEGAVSTLGAEGADGGVDSKGDLVGISCP